MSNYGKFLDEGGCYIVSRPDLPAPINNFQYGAKILSSVDQLGSGGLTVRDGENKPYELIHHGKFGRLFYLRDNDSGEFWSPAWTPVNTMPDSYEATFHPQLTTINSSTHEIETSLTIIDDPKESFEVWQFTLTNKNKARRRLSLVASALWSLGDTEAIESLATKNLILTANLHQNPEVSRPVGFFKIEGESNDSFTWENELISPYENLARPKTIIAGRFKKDASKIGRARVGFQKNITLAPGAQTTVRFYVGGIYSLDKDTLTVQRDRLTTQVNRITKLYLNNCELEKIVESGVKNAKIFTTEKEFDQYFNHFLAQQKNLNSTWPTDLRVTKVEDIYDALVNSVGVSEEIAEAHLFNLIAHQYKDGRVAHDWQGEKIIDSIRTEIIDTLLLGSAIRLYINEYGELEILRNHVDYLDSGSGSILEHLTKAINYIIESLTSDKMLEENGIGSTALTARFIYELRGIIALLKDKHEEYLIKKYSQLIDVISEKIEKTLWLTPWYGRGRNEKGRINTATITRGWDLSAQLWPIIAGVPAETKIKTMVDRLAKYTSATGPINFTGAYLKPERDNKLSASNPGQGNNSVIDVETACLFIKVATIARQGEVAWRIVSQISPNFLASNFERYLSEPFWLCDRIDGSQSITPGRGHTLPNSPAGTFSKAITENIYGIQSRPDGLHIDPCLPKSWRQVELSYHWRDADWHFRIQNPFRTGSGVSRIVVDGIRLNGNVVRPLKPGLHYVEVILG